MNAKVEETMKPKSRNTAKAKKNIEGRHRKCKNREFGNKNGL